MTRVRSGGRKAGCDARGPLPHGDPGGLTFTMLPALGGASLLPQSEFFPCCLRFNGVTPGLERPPWSGSTMRWKLGLLLVSAVLAGCIGDQGAGDRPIDGQQVAEGAGSGGGQETGSGGGQTTATATAYTLNDTVELGWVAAVGVPDLAGTGGAEAGESSSQLCPTAELRVTQGADKFQVTISAEALSTEGPGAGSLAIEITSPSGETSVREGIFMLTMATNTVFEASRPVNGTWRLEASPEGPVVLQTWTLEVGLEGASPTPPAGLALATTC